VIEIRTLYRARVVAAIVNGAATTREIELATGTERRSVQRVVSRLVQAGLLSQTSKWSRSGRCVRYRPRERAVWLSEVVPAAAKVLVSAELAERKVLQSFLPRR